MKIKLNKHNLPFLKDSAKLPHKLLDSVHLKSIPDKSINYTHGQINFNLY
jgi:hypothetical protein